MFARSNYEIKNSKMYVHKWFIHLNIQRNEIQSNSWSIRYGVEIEVN